MRPMTFSMLRLLADGRFHSGQALGRELRVSRSAIWQAVRAIAPSGLRVYCVRGRGYRLERAIEFLDPQTINDALEAERLPIRAEVHDALESTNSFLRDHPDKPHGTCVLAEWQSAGRGRQGNSWHMVPGDGLAFSLKWCFSGAVSSLSGLSLAVGVAVADACEACGVAGVDLKWPNDVLHCQRKLAGVLIDVQGEALGPTTTIIGIGINYRQPETLVQRIDQPITSITAIADPTPSRHGLWIALLKSLARVLDEFTRSGFAGLRHRWEARNAWLGNSVTVSGPGRLPIPGILERA